MYETDNVFAKIIRGELPCEKLYEDDTVLAFHDIAKAAPVHVLVIPKGAFSSFDDFISKASEEEVNHFFKIVKHIAHTLKLQESGYRIITNHGHDASQTVAHFHIHILGGRPLGGLLPNDTLTR